MRAMIMIKVYHEGEEDFSFFPKKGLWHSEIVKEALALFEQKHQRPASALISLDRTERVDVGAIDDEIKRGWAPGAKTIPVLSFEAKG